MKLKKKSLIILSVLAFVCVMPLLFAAGGEAAAEQGDETSSYVKFVSTIFGQEPGEPARFITFLGRFHPLVLHLPIGMVVLAFHLMAFAIWKKRDDFDLAYCITMGFALVTGCIAALFGSFLAIQNDYNVELIDRHGWGGLVFVILIGVSFGLMVKFLKSDKSKDTLKKVSVGILGANLLVMSLVGHDGGSMTHGKTYLVEYGPNWVRALEGLPPWKEPGEISGEDTVYEALVAPFLKKHCYECHSEAKIKGKLRLDTIDFIKQGGKHEDDDPLIVHGNAEGSNLYHLMVIDDEDEIMPPDGMLPQSHTDFIKWWIDTAENDADLFERKIKDANVPEKFMNINKKGKKAKVPHKGADEEAKAAPTEKVEEKVAEVKEKVEEAVAPATAGVDFAKQVAPIFEARCIKCHGEKKQKGEYRMDKAEFIQVAGESEEKPVVSGKPDESYLVKLIKMSDEDDDVMPPKGGTLKPEEIAIIVKWIEEGAKFPADLQLEDKSPKK